MKKAIFTLTFLHLIFFASAQQNRSAVKYAGLTTPELAKQQLSIIASNAYERRETGFSGADKAANYVMQNF